MKVAVYQIIPELDEQGMLFRDLTFVKVAGGGNVPAELYECVYSGELPVTDPEQVFVICNTNHPDGYHGHSLSISDVVEFQYDAEKSKFFFCDTWGFEEIAFDKDKTMLSVSNHNFDCVSEIYSNIRAYFMTSDGLQRRLCERMLLQRCRYSQSQIGYELECWNYGVTKPDKFQFLNRPKVVLTSGIWEFPDELLYDSIGVKGRKSIYPVHSDKNLELVIQWLKDNRFEYEELKLDMKK